MWLTGESRWPAVQWKKKLKIECSLGITYWRFSGNQEKFGVQTNWIIQKWKCFSVTLPVWMSWQSRRCYQKKTFNIGKRDWHHDMSFLMDGVRLLMSDSMHLSSLFWTVDQEHMNLCEDCFPSMRNASIRTSILWLWGPDKDFTRIVQWCAFEKGFTYKGSQSTEFREDLNMK